MSKIYLAGPMRGYPNFNFPAFNTAAAKLRAEGHEVFNPAEADVKTYGDKIADSPSGSERTAAKKVGLSAMELKRQVFMKDCTAICTWADTVALLPGWKQSKGANAEKALADAIGLEVIILAKDYIK